MRRQRNGHKLDRDWSDSCHDDDSGSLTLKEHVLVKYFQTFAHLGASVSTVAPIGYFLGITMIDIIIISVWKWKFLENCQPESKYRGERGRLL